jgi:hypothetical protein
MAYYTKYRTEFSEIEGIDWKVDIQQDLGGDPGITTLTATGNPLTFDWYGSDDILTQNIVGSKMSLNVWVDTDFQLIEFFTTEILKYKVIVYYGATPYWYGFLTADSYSESYDTVPYTATISATDGLGLLKEFKFSDLAYNSRQSYAKVISDILALLSISSFTEYVNLYNADMSATTADSPFTQIGIDPDLFTTDNCYDALNTMLATFDACIQQDLGAIVIYRFLELKNATIYGRVFASAAVYSTTSKSTAQYINRVGTVSQLVDVNGGTLTALPQAKTLILNYDLGLKESALKHWEFNFDDFALIGTWTIPDWTASYAIMKPVSLAIPGEEKGVWLDCYVAGSPYKYIYQDLANVKTRSPSFIISLEYRTYNADVSLQNQTIYYLIVSIGASDKFWKGTSGLGNAWSSTSVVPPDATSTYWIDANTPSGWSDWKTKELLITSVPIDCTFRLYLYASVSAAANVSIAYRNVKLVFPPTGGAENIGIGYTVTCSTIGKIIENEIHLGDGFTSERIAVNEIISYAGVMNGISGGSPITPSIVWHTIGNTENIPILSIISQEQGTQYAQPRLLVDLPVVVLGSSFVSCTGTLQDSRNINALSSVRIFAVNISSYSVADRFYQLILTEIL